MWFSNFHTSPTCTVASCANSDQCSRCHRIGAFNVASVPEAAAFICVGPAGEGVCLLSATDPFLSPGSEWLSKLFSWRVFVMYLPFDLRCGKATAFTLFSSVEPKSRCRIDSGCWPQRFQMHFIRKPKGRGFV